MTIKHRDMTMKDVEDLIGMKGTLLDVLVAVGQRADEIRKSEIRAAAQKQKAETPPPPKKKREKGSAASRASNYYSGEASSSSAAASKKRKNYNFQPRRRGKEPQPPQPQPPPPLPEDFKNAIEEMARGRALTPATLVIQKWLYGTDLSSYHNRLSIPIAQIRDDFLTEEEKRHLRLRRSDGKKRNYLEVRIVEPSTASETVKFSRWDMAKDNGSKTSSCYVINGKWKDIMKRNVLRVGMVVQLWCFRVDQYLCFALVRLPTNPSVAGDAA